MTRHTRAFLLIALSFTLSAYAQQPATRVPSSSASSSASSSFAPAAATSPTSRVRTIQFESKLVGKTLPYNVLLPVDYDAAASKTKRYPVIYLLHGLTGHYTNWFEKTKLADHAAPYDLIVVTPEGNDGWYTDSVSVPTEKYETYFMEELLPDVQRRYRTVEAREGRAIAGLSMGGYGALKFGMKYPQAFAFAGSMSGAIDAASWKEADLKAWEFIRRSFVPVFGPDNTPHRAANDVEKFFRELPPEKFAALPFIYFACGTEDHMLSTNREFAELLRQRKIPHEYREGSGGHTWTYWDAQVQEVLKSAVKRLRTCDANC